MKAVLYVRVSSQEQKEDGYSLSAQEREGLFYAERHGFQIVQKWAVSESAKTDNRKAFNEMMEYLKDHKDIPIVLIEKADRMTRNFNDLVKVYDLIENYDKEIHLFRQGQVLNKNSRSHEKLHLDLNVVLARQYINNLSEETKKGMYQKADQGEYPGLVPLGYKNNRETRKIEVNPQTSPLVRRMFELYATGNYSLMSLRDEITRSGLRVRNGKELMKSNVEKILKNHFYYGDFEWGKQRYRGTHTPLISKELYDEVQRRMRRPVKAHEVKRTFPYTGLLTCKYCGCAVTAEIRKGRYIYYHCTYSKGKCGNGYVRQEDLEKVMEGYIRSIHIPEDRLNKIVTTLKDSHQTEKEFREKALQGLTEQYNRLQRKIDRLYEDKLDGIINEAFWREKNEQFRLEQENTRHQIAKYEKANKDYVETGLKILNYAGRILEEWKVRRPEEKRKLFNFIASNCVLDTKNPDSIVDVSFKKPFDLLVNPDRSLKWGG